MNLSNLTLLSSKENPFLLLRSIPFFSQFSAEQLKELLSLMQPVNCKEQDWVVEEGELVKEVFIILDGFAEVLQKKRHYSTQLKTLSRGDTIGLSSGGFFSLTGQRTASVRALSDLTLLSLSVNQINQFLQKNSLTQLDLFKTSNLFARMEFIKSITLFSKLPLSDIHHLAEKVEEVSLAANSVLFHQGEIGNKCYLIESGELKAIVKDDINSTERVVATLHAPMIVGETSLLIDSPRNASILASTDCKLLAIEKADFQAVVKNEQVSQEASLLLISRSKPKRLSAVTAYHRQTPDGEKITLLKNPDKGSYYRLSRVGWYIWQLLDGKHTIQEITDEIFDNFFIFSPELVNELILGLIEGDFLEIPMGKFQTKLTETKLTWWQKGLKRLAKFMDFQYSFKNTDLFVTKHYRRWGHWFYNLPVQISFLIILFVGSYAFVTLTHPAIANFKNTSLLFFLTYVPLALFTVLSHEFAHALTTKFFGQEVLRLGVGWYWFSPIAFADTSDMWLSTRWKRVAVNVAGIYVNLVFAGLVSIIGWLILPQFPELSSILWLTAFFNYLTAFQNLDPTLLCDGYYISMDILNKTNLRKETALWLSETLPHMFREKQWNLLKKHKKEIAYLLICIGFLATSAGLTFWLQHSIVSSLFHHVIDDKAHYYHYISWIFPFLVIIFASIGLWVEIREQRIRRQIAKRETALSTLS